MIDKFIPEIAEKIIKDGMTKEVETLIKCTLSLLSGDMSLIKRTPDKDIKALHAFLDSIILPNLIAMPNVTKIVLPNPDFCAKCANFKENYKGYAIFCLKTEQLSTGSTFDPNDPEVVKINKDIPRKCPLNAAIVPPIPATKVPMSSTVH